MTDKPTVLFVCVHDAGHSQMAAGYLNALSGGRWRSSLPAPSPSTRYEDCRAAHLRRAG